MTWAANLSNDSETEVRFVRATCKLRVSHTLFTLVSGNVYKASFTYGPVVAMWNASTSLTADTSTSPTSGKYYYDRTTQFIYINLGHAPTSADFVVASFYLFMASEECLWYETPTDSTSTVVQWTPLLKTAPSFRMTIPIQSVGYFPIEPTSLELLNDHSLNYLIGKGSFYRSACEAWYQLGSRTTANIQKTLTGIFGMRISVREDVITFDVVDKSFTFDGPTLGGSYFTQTAVDPKFNGTSMMMPLGSNGSGGSIVNVPLYEMVNIDYNATGPTTANNRKFGLIYDPSSKYAELSIHGNAVNSQFNGASSMAAYQDGMKVWFDSDAGAASDLYLTIDVVGGTQVFFTTATSGVLKPGNLRASVFKEVIIVKNGETPFRLAYGRDYTDTVHSGSVRGVTLTAGAEASVGCATFDPSTDFLYALIDGPNNQLSNGGSNVGSPVSAKTATQVLYQFLREQCGMAESDIDFTTFTAADTYITWSIYVPIPFSQFEDYPDCRTVLDVLLKSMLVRGYFGADGLFKIKAYKPISTTAESILKEEITEYEYTIDYSNMKNISMVAIWDSRARARLAYAGSKDQILAGTSSLRVVQDEANYGVSTATSSSEGLYLHGIDTSETFEHCVYGAVGSEFESRVRDLYGERSGSLKITGKRIALQREPGDDLTVYRDSLVGLDDATGNSANFELLEVEKSDESVTATLSDNKAADDKSSETYW